MNQTTEALYLALLNSGKLETEATQTAFCEAYDYIIDLAECESNEEEKDKVFHLLADIEAKARKVAFAVGLQVAFAVGLQAAFAVGLQAAFDLVRP